MTALVPTRGLADSLAELFDPVDDAPIEALLAEYADKRATIDRLAAIFADDRTTGVLGYFIAGAEIRESYAAERMFSPEYAMKARKALDADYWSKALAATDVLAVMPAARRKEWHDQIEARDVPEFCEAALRSTLREHLAARHTYFAERVDGLFQALSPEHVTNSPAGFGGKLIIGYMTDSDGDPVFSRVPLLVDLRVVVARFMGRTASGEGSNLVHALTRDLVRYARRERRGEWVVIDGGAIEIKCHKSGTCHIRLHAELVWRLNAVLASVHPGAIPESARTRPKRGSVKKTRTVELMLRPLPFAVVRALAEFRPRTDGWSYGYTWSDLDKHVRAEVLAVLASIGGVPVGAATWGEHRFGYDPTGVLAEIVVSGAVPDQRAHQFYPTPRHLAERVVVLADIGPTDVVLEPSAGQGHLAELLPRDRTVCVEASAMHCEILRSKGFTTIHSDFLRPSSEIASAIANMWRQGLADGVTRVVMNPPFDRGQWRPHVEHAARVLSPRRGAKLVSVLPASAASRLDLPGFTLTWSEPIEGAFAGTSISVVILTAEREA